MLHTHVDLERVMTDAADLRRAEKRVEELESERDDLKEQAADLQSNVENLKGEMEDLKGEMEDLRDERDRLREKIASLSERERENTISLALEREIRKAYSAIEIEDRSFDGKEIGYLLDMLDVIRASRVSCTR